MKDNKYSAPLMFLFLLIAVMLSSCNDKLNEIDNIETSKLILDFNEIQEGVELEKQTLEVNEFTTLKIYKEWESSNSVWLNLKFNFQGVTNDNQNVSGYIQFASVEGDLNKVILKNDSWEYLDPMDMKDFLSDDMVVVMNEAGYNDRNDSLSTMDVEFINETFLINRSCSGKAWHIYMDGINGYNITKASFKTHYKG